MKRFVYQGLVSWKNKSNRKPLILNGARQVGKTWLLREFGSGEYAKTAYFSCDRMPSLRNLFTGDFNPKNVFLGLSSIAGVDITPNDTLIVFDEIQALPEVLTALKFFAEETPEYHIAAAGSLLGIAIHEGFSFPVGKVDSINVYPMSFEEFLLANGKEHFFDILNSRNYDVMKTLNSQYTELLRQYYFVGGMPAAVKAFVDGEGPNQVRSIQNEILSNYKTDISKHPSNTEIQRINLVWENIPSQLAKDNKRFIFSTLRKGARASQFEMAIEWLMNAGLVYKVTRVKKPVIPLKFYVDMNGFKLFMLDCGLMGAMSNTPPSQILIENNIFSEYKGTFTEQFVLQEIKSLGNIPIYYAVDDNSRWEIDFIVQCADKVIPIEVKAEDNLRSKSLSQYVNDNPGLRGLRFSLSSFRSQSWLDNVPLYAIESELKYRNSLS